jgi:hypothetical protein
MSEHVPSKERGTSVEHELQVLRQLAEDCRAPRECRAIEFLASYIEAMQAELSAASAHEPEALRDALEAIASPCDTKDYGWWTETARNALGMSGAVKGASPQGRNSGVTPESRPHSAPPPADEWQPIATAPRDGKSFMVYCSGRRNTFIAYRKEAIYGDAFMLFGASERQLDNDPPTHWRPLPPDPYSGSTKIAE